MSVNVPLLSINVQISGSTEKKSFLTFIKINFSLLSGRDKATNAYRVISVSTVEFHAMFCHVL